MKTYWCAETNNNDEWLSVDLEKICLVNALQINFADDEYQDYKGRGKSGHCYIIEMSKDGIEWETLIDKSKNKDDVPNDYIQLENPVKTRYFRIRNIHFPVGSRFSIRDFRIFGDGLGKLPEQVRNFRVNRTPDDTRRATISWEKTKNTVGYIVRYGITDDGMYNNFQVYEEEQIVINCLNAGVDYYFTIDTFNENGVTFGEKVIKVEG